MTVLSPTIVAIEGGGTRTRAWLAAGTAAVPCVLARREAGPSNLHTVGADGVARLVHELLDGVVADAGIGRSGIAVVSLGLAGVASGRDVSRVTDAVRGSGYAGLLEVSSDARATVAGAVGESGGIVLIAGTGSIALGLDPAGREARAGGWGPGVGDEGSAMAIGRELLARVARSLDGRDRPTDLVDATLRHLGLSSTKELTRWIREEARSPEAIASVAPVVTSRGSTDPVARRILERAAVELTRLVRAVKSRLRLPASARLALHGGLLAAAGPYHALVVNRLARAFPRLSVTAVDPEAALRGLVLLGHRRLSREALA